MKNRYINITSSEARLNLPAFGSTIPVSPGRLERGGALAPRITTSSLLFPDLIFLRWIHQPVVHSILRTS
jgi:hypothetical protein